MSNYKSAIDMDYTFARYQLRFIAKAQQCFHYIEYRTTFSFTVKDGVACSRMIECGSFGDKYSSEGVACIELLMTN